jgi:hypothetical protein
LRALARWTFATLPAPFIAPILCERLTDPRRLADRRYVAERSSMASARNCTSMAVTRALSRSSSVSVGTPSGSAGA